MTDSHADRSNLRGYDDYPTQARIPKRSAHWYRRLIADHKDLVRAEQSTSTR